MGRVSNILVLAGFALMALFYVLAIYEGPIGHCRDYNSHGIVILIATLGSLLASAGGTMGTTSAVLRSLGVVLIILPVFLSISISLAIFVYPASTIPI
jgi:hypothetical protein